MSSFTLEIVQSGETPVLVDVVSLHEGRVSWRQVEALALMIDSPDNTFIRVKNHEGKTVIRAGVRTTLASIHQCPCMDCPLKRAFAKRSTAEGGAGGQFRSVRRFLDDPALYPCEMALKPQGFASLFENSAGD